MKSFAENRKRLFTISGPWSLITESLQKNCRKNGTSSTTLYLK